MFERTASATPRTGRMQQTAEPISASTSKCAPRQMKQGELDLGRDVPAKYGHFTRMVVSHVGRKLGSKFRVLGIQLSLYLLPLAWPRRGCRVGCSVSSTGSLARGGVTGPDAPRRSTPPRGTNLENPPVIHYQYKCSTQYTFLRHYFQGSPPHIQNIPPGISGSVPD